MRWIVLARSISRSCKALVVLLKDWLPGKRKQLRARGGAQCLPNYRPLSVYVHMSPRRDQGVEGARVLITKGRYAGCEGVCLESAGDGKKWAISPDGTTEIIDLRFDEEFGLLIDERMRSVQIDFAAELIWTEKMGR